jgi:hypothetical protein
MLLPHTHTVISDDSVVVELIGPEDSEYISNYVYIKL